MDLVDLNYSRMGDPSSPGEHIDRLVYMMVHINELHYSYLHAHEGLQKLEDKKRLEGHIRDYLMVAPHDKKFLYHETSLILHRSVQFKENFSGIRASGAWTAIAAYAHNLLAQSWRKEFREIQTHSGFYKHNVESGLIGSEIMLTLMGYKEIADGIYVLDGPVDPDRVANVSRDSLVALVECQILCSLYADLLRSGCNYTWLDILEYREAHPGTLEQALHGLMYQYNQRYLSTCRPECYPKCNIMDRGIYNPPPYRMHNAMQVPYYSDTPDGLTMMRPCYAGNSRGQTCSTCLKDYNPLTPPPLRHSNICTVPTVPTGQLIELDVSYHGKENYAYDTDNQLKTLSDKMSSVNLSDGNSNQLKYRHNKDSGWDTWGGASYEPPEIKKNAKYDIKSDPRTLGAYDEAFKVLNLDDSPQPSCSTSDPKLLEKPVEKSVKKKPKPDSSNTLPGSVQTLGREVTKKPDVNYMSLKVKLNDKWECPTCTFHNSNDKDVCEMCSKSKTSGNEVQPLVSGGRQCPKCTLVNEKGVTVCDACGENLKDSPTYI